jgi:hypothetical protein
MTDLLLHAAVWGLVVSVWLTITFIALSRLNPEMWLNDYPPDIRAKHGPMSPKANRLRFLLGVPVMVVALGIVAIATIDLVRTVPTTGFLAIALHTFVLMTVFNIIDLLLIDWLLFVRVRPAFVVLPGTEGMAGYDDYAFHWRAFLKGTAGIAVLSVIVAGIATLISQGHA